MQLVSLFEPHKVEIKVLAGLHSLPSGGSREESVFRLIQVVGRIQLPRLLD